MKSRYDIYVVGMRVEKYIGIEASDDFEACDTQLCNDEKYILCCIVKIYQDYCRKYTITLSSIGGWCGSGYTTATWGDMKIEEVNDFGPFTHRPKDGLPIKIENAYFDSDKGLCFEKIAEDENRYTDVANNVFEYSCDGCDEYYPGGWVSVNMDLFAKHKRTFQERPVWIFTGESATGKSTLGCYLKKNKIVFETDALKEGEELPEFIWADIIVLGNKHKITIQDVASHLPKGTEIITVDFYKGYLNE